MESTTCEKSCRSKGLTLIEVVVGLALLATLLVSILTAYGRHTHQVRRAQRRLDAIRATDRMLGIWFTQKQYPRQQSGVVYGEATMRWRMTSMANPALDSWSMQIVRLEVYDAETTDPDQEPLTTVDLVVQKSPKVSTNIASTY